MAIVSHPQSHADLEPWNKDQDTVYALNRGDLTKERERLEYNHRSIFLLVAAGSVPSKSRHILRISRTLALQKLPPAPASG
ncbi:hypothetical protein CPAR01_05655 [Colletotrichum paranaense]|uniref:Uncharacterized protein n=1 Tax=Colletotrichum paranaense TaxID=1914294 RepID=A0ABQ9SRW2_9PEZI|nr:uncharacterized protein CPAR01_05655 [Colletotrichum paranaense]KAK1542268.1 hypothetical protein CPAR01_05655 [Colletotrichum paranaense]